MAKCNVSLLSFDMQNHNNNNNNNDNDYNNFYFLTIVLLSFTKLNIACGVLHKSNN